MSKKNYTWKNPLAVWGAKGGNYEVPSIKVEDPRSVWDKNKTYQVALYKVGRFKYIYKWKNHGARLWKRLRWWPTRRTLLHIRGYYNKKSLKAQKLIVDKRPIYWVVGLFALAVAPFFFPESMQNTLLTAGAVFGIFAAINVCWTLVIGTASIFSLATYAVVGVAAFCTSWLSINLGYPWWSLPLIGMAIGFIFGGIIALPAMRLDGFYYALLTLGLNELCRVYVVTSKEFGSASGGLYGASTYINSDWPPLMQSMVSYYGAFALLIAALFLFRFIDGKRIGRLLKMAPEKREAFAEATGVNYKQARITVFLISSVALGFIGGFYAAHYRGVAFSIFSFDTLLLGLAMLTIGGIGKAEGAIVGTLIVVLLDKVLITLGPVRHIMIGLLMLFVVLFLNKGLFGMKQQFRAWRDKKKGEWRSTRTEKGGEALPEEATEIDDKDYLYHRRFDKMQRDYLKNLVCDEIIDEHKNKPLGQHSEALERLLLYFRRVPQNDKYAIKRDENSNTFKIVAFSGVRGMSPRLVEDKEYNTIEDAYHGVFVRRVYDLLES
ncbi:MAG: branched-chain amino acid ABC transporter permease [Gammaproteobacteria bacterium]|nr:branched-chain amino acid ABC transporter permease [Gammaproteobacteria bacterium]